ncbi:hypothetical protein BB934_32325 (plasmid) [Microvirga ossetica]|uniref:Uncharacterized protein n=1 Tax=Microvirga ossetica TaxID=1882682 RepID=A0A1B2ESG8_9HYPH|nr:hypothetical protein BB934_32325 [Microvirga ossetica]
MRKYTPKHIGFIGFVVFPTDAALIFPHKWLERCVPWEQRVICQTAEPTLVEDHPLVKSLQAILKEMDDQYERQRQDLIATLPNSHVKDRALTMLESRHHQRRENYSRELAALLAGA